MSTLARCSSCHRTSGLVDPDTADAWASAHQCHRLTDAEAMELSRLGACLAFTREQGWHLIPVAEGVYCSASCRGLAFRAKQAAGTNEAGEPRV
jgi:hypothetical protein